MKTQSLPRRRSPALAFVLLVSLAAVALRAQTAPAPVVSAADLAKYDLNRNGRLDPSEAATRQADQNRAAASVVSAPAPSTGAGETVVLSPFEVKEDNTGYYASTTMSGTRMNTKIADLPASISVVTKAQMQDFGLLDLNDIFNYEASTEGTGNFTAFEVDRNGMVTDQVQNNPQGANRIRGVGAANIAVDNFATSGRVPVDPINIDAVEISRGPNSSIFGLGEGSGTVNMVSASANLSRETTTLEGRVDDLGGWRSSLDLNRPLIPGKLAVRVSGVYQHDAYPQKPSGFETRRFNGMIRFQPFRKTVVRGSFQSYRGVGTRATSITPKDGISYWKSVGSPTWNPLTSVVTRDGVPTQVTWATNGNPVGGLPLGLANPNFTRPTVFLDNGIQLWTIARMPAATATNGPNNQSGINRLLETVAEPVRTGHPLFSTVPGISDPSIYDWENVNLAGPNTIKDGNDLTTVTIEQTILDSDRQKLALQGAWQREDADRINRNVIGSASATSASYYVYVDVNEFLLDGRRNPYFRRPYIGVGEPVTEEQPLNRDSYRGQLAYILDLSKEANWTRWLGRHQILGYQESRKSKSFRFRYRDVMTSDNPVYAPAGQPKGNQSGTAAPVATRPYYHFYVGDASGSNIDQAPVGYSLGRYPFQWFNPDPDVNDWQTDTVTLGRSGINEGTAGSFSVLNLIKTKGWALNSGLFDDRVIVTIGRRSDENRNKPQKPSVLKPNGWEFDYAAMDGWVGDWALREGDTKTEGLVVRPFRNWAFIERRRGQGGLVGFGAEVLGGLQFHYNKSDSFRPEPPAISILTTDLPNPFAVQKEYGFSLNLWNNKVVFRANHYTNDQLKSRAGQSAIFATRTLRVDFAPFAGSNDATALQRQARNWVTEANPGWNATQIADEVARIMKLDSSFIDTINNNVISETSDVLAKGDEYELFLNPTPTWTLRMNVVRSESLDANLSPNIPAWVAKRLPEWETIIDPRSGMKWLDTGYSGDDVNPGSTNTPRRFLTNNVINPLNLARATEGKSRPQVREWRVNVSTSYRLSNLFDNKYLKRMGVGGALRWESRGAIGYYGVPINGDITAATEFDANRPIWDEPHTYVDAFVTYTTRLFNDRVRARFQLNCRNLQESGRLQAVGAYPDGRPHTFRIINPRTFFFTTTFEL